MSGRRRSYEGALAGVKALVNEQTDRRKEARQFQYQTARDQQQRQHDRTMQDARQAFDERLMRATQQQITERAYGTEALKQAQPASPADQLKQQQLGMAGLQAPLPEGGFRQAELDNPAMMRTQVQPMLQRRQQALQDVGLVQPPASQRPVDPLVQANRVGQLQQRLQQIEMANQLGPLMAEGERQQAATPGWLGPIGRSVPPPVSVTPQDTSYLRGQLQPYLDGAPPQTATGGDQRVNDPITQRIADLRAQGMPDAQIAQFLREKGRDPRQYGLE